MTVDDKSCMTDNWESLPVDRVCDQLCEQPQLIDSCPDAVWLKFRLGHWAKLIRATSQRSAVVDKMKSLGVAERMISDWCCPHHWAEEYGSVFHVLAAASPKEQKIRHIAENSAMNPQWDSLGRGVRYHSDIPRHIQWLASMAADFAAMAAESAKTAPEYGYAEEYALIAEAANYEIQVLNGKVCPEVVKEKGQETSSGGNSRANGDKLWVWALDYEDINELERDFSVWCSQASAKARMEKEIRDLSDAFHGKIEREDDLHAVLDERFYWSIRKIKVHGDQDVDM